MDIYRASLFIEELITFYGVVPTLCLSVSENAGQLFWVQPTTRTTISASRISSFFMVYDLNQTAIIANIV
jgi:hypothetical protein